MATMIKARLSVLKAYETVAIFLSIRVMAHCYWYLPLSEGAKSTSNPTIIARNAT